MGASNPGLMGDYGQGQMYGYDQHSMAAHHQGHADAWNLNAMGTHYQVPTAAHDPKLVSDWSQYQISGLNLNPMDTHDPNLVSDWSQYQMGAMNLNPVDTRHQSGIDSHQLSHMNPQNTNDADDLMKLFQSSRPIKTRVNRSPHDSQDHDGPQSAMPYRRALPYPNLSENIPFIDTSRFLRKKHSKNSGSRSKGQEE